MQSLTVTTHFIPPLNFLERITKLQFTPSKPYPFQKFLKRCRLTPKCSLSAVSEPAYLELLSNNGDNKPFPAEISRTIMELSTVGTLSTLTQDAWPLGFGVQFSVDDEGTPILCLNASNAQLSVNNRSSLHVQLEQGGLRTPQCTIQGSLDKPEDRTVLKRLHSVWKKRFGEEMDEDLVYVVCVDRVLHMENFQENGVWVSSSDYRNANPDPLRDFAQKIVDEINTNNMEDIRRFCNIYVDLDFQVSEAKVMWVDRLGFDMRLCSPQKGVFEVRIPFPREVTDEKGAKSSFNCMSQLAWEVEKNFHVSSDFKKVKQLKQIA